MKNIVLRRLSKKLILWATMFVLAVGTLFFAAPKPALAGSSFSISIGSGPYHVGYRTWHGHGYRYWHPSYFDGWHRWHAGYWSGPVVYQPEYGNYGGGVRYHSYNHRRSYGGGGWQGGRDNRRWNH